MSQGVVSVAARGWGLGVRGQIKYSYLTRGYRAPCALNPRLLSCSPTGCWHLRLLDASSMSLPLRSGFCSRRTSPIDWLRN